MDKTTDEWLCVAYKNLLNRAEVEICPTCGGSGVIVPVENPPYKCGYCNGRGWISPYAQEADELRKEVSELRAKLAETEAADDVGREKARN